MTKTIEERVEEFRSRFLSSTNAAYSLKYGLQEEAGTAMLQAIRTALTEHEAQVREEAAIRELDILELHLRKQIIAPTVSTSSIYSYLDARREALTPNHSPKYEAGRQLQMKPKLDFNNHSEV